jgi:uncharacterized protein (TIGR00296 family)
MIGDFEGEQLVRTAREVVERFLKDNVVPSIHARTSFTERMGVFVTLMKIDDAGQENLRGCVGFPLPEKELSKSLAEAAVAAASSDPRFPPLSPAELKRTIFEVSVLTPLEIIKVKRPTEYYEHIMIGRDGLVLRWEGGSGLLLPQVAKEMGWDVDDYLTNLCFKAGAPPDVWLMPTSKLYKFQAIVYREAEPHGRVIKL